MKLLLELKDASKRYADQVLLDRASVVIPDAYKIGLIGRNGAGKSTLCRILSGEEELDAGEVVRSSELRLGYLRQHDPFEPGESVLGFLMRDSSQPEWRCGEMAWQFELKGPALERPVRELSGGWQTRVKLAALLLHAPNLLLLDEPTNFLDLRTQLLLEEFLRGFRAACLIVSHDRAFLKATCERTLELSRGQLTMFPGDVDVYLEHQQERIKHDQRVNAAVAAKRRQLETFIAKNRANASTASQARSKAKQLERLQLMEIETPESTVRMRVPEVEPRRGSAVRCLDLAIGYPDHEVAAGIEVEVVHGARMALVGDNGQGKTTFLRTMTGSLPPLAGGIKWGYGCDVGVYAQHVYTALPAGETVLEYLTAKAAPEVKAQQVLDVAGSFLFRGEQVEKRISVLSGGERARLCLAGLLLGRHNVLVMDEPGNHLDVETVEALAEALNSYRGTIVFTSHDRYFMQQVATGVLEVRDGRVADYPGKYSDYLQRARREIAAGARPPQAASATPAPAKARPVESREDRKEQARRRYELQKELGSLERQIQKHEQRRADLEQQLLTVTTAADAERLQRALSEVHERLEPIEQRWLEVSEEIGA